ncbi:MAG: Cytosine-specific methyltransferase, partial [Negativicoccus succinicivorans DORA_17_25]
MLKIGTVFSGIGAIEHALQRMGIPHKIVFACDNGDVDVFKKKIDLNIVDILDELDKLSEKIVKMDTHEQHQLDYIKKDLDASIKKINKKISEIDESIVINNPKNQILSDYSIDDIIMINSNGFEIDVVENVKKYMKQFKIATDGDTDIYYKFKIRNKILDKLLLIGEISTELKKELIKNKDSEFKNTQEWFETFKKNKQYREARKFVKLILEDIQMLNEKVETLSVLKELSKIENYK